MTADTITAIKKALEGVTPGPWKWFGNAGSQHVYLATTHSGRRYVMDFVRWGMRGAQPRFQPERGGMVDAKDLLQFEVGDQSIVGIDAARKDGSVYRYDVRGIDCPDARYIAAVNPAAIIDLLSTLESLQRENASLKQDLYDLAYAITGGEDAPGLLDSVPTSQLVEIARNTHRSHSADIARAEAAEAEVKRLREAETLETYYERQIEWSRETFGHALRTKGIIDHIKKELREIEADPHDLSEWVDVVILAMDGFWRHGGSAGDLFKALIAKQQENMARTWPDWRTMSEDSAIEHDRSKDALASTGGEHHAK